MYSQKIRNKMEKETHELKNGNLKNFIFAGNSTFTVVNEITGNRFTFKVRNSNYKTPEPKTPSDIFYVSVLTGQDNNSAYTFLGTFFGGKNELYRHSPKSKITNLANSNKVVDWFFNYFLKSPNKYSTIKVYHSGKCGKCGKKLTTPESVESGLGPYCGSRV